MNHIHHYINESKNKFYLYLETKYEVSPSVCHSHPHDKTAMMDS